MSERRIYLATSALSAQNFDAFQTIEEASSHGFHGVQLFINLDYHQEGYNTSLVSELKRRHLSPIVHLPNLPTKPDIKVAQDLVGETQDSLVLVHYQPLTQLPLVRGTTVGWENSINGPDIEHVDEVRRHVAQDDTFFVYDYGRLMNTDSPKVKQKIRDYLSATIPQLRPGKDIIHIADKLYWEQRFRQCPCVLGQGIVSEFLPQVKDFVAQGGRLVFEQEDLKMAVDSLKVFD